MTRYIINNGVKLSKTNPDNLYLAISDWFVLGENLVSEEKNGIKNVTILNGLKTSNVI